MQVGVKACVAFGCFENVRVVREGNIGAPDNENEYYAPGVGVIKNVPLDASLHQDRFELVNFLTLSAEGLAAASLACWPSRRTPARPPLRSSGQLP